MRNIERGGGNDDTKWTFATKSFTEDEKTHQGLDDQVPFPVRFESRGLYRAPAPTASSSLQRAPGQLSRAASEPTVRARLTSPKISICCHSRRPAHRRFARPSSAIAASSPNPTPTPLCGRVYACVPPRWRPRFGPEQTYYPPSHPLCPSQRYAKALQAVAASRGGCCSSPGRLLQPRREAGAAARGGCPQPTICHGAPTIIDAPLLPVLLWILPLLQCTLLWALTPLPATASQG
eukprot:357329-Chlamydomonas_euryale.AAC.16